MKYKQNTSLYRTRDEIVKDVVVVLCSSELNLAAKRAVIDQALWTWTEFDGKHSERLRWSVAARQLRTDTGNTKNLVHEHAIPRKLLRKWLFNLDAPNFSNVNKLFGNYCVAAIILDKEDKKLNKDGLRSKMPDTWDGEDVWARYTLAGIELIQSD